MTAISPGDEVTVTITGTVTSLMGETGFEMVYPDGRTYRAWYLHPDVKVTVLRPDRPTRREVLYEHTPIMAELPYGGTVTDGCSCGDTYIGHNGAHQFIAHLDEVLTKWEEN